MYDRLRSPTCFIAAHVVISGHDRVVDFMHASELLMPQARHDPAFDDLHCRLHLCFVLGMVGARRENRGTVMAREVEHRVVAAWLVAIGVRDQRPRIIGNDERGHAAIKAQSRAVDSSQSAIVSRGVAQANV